MNLNFWNKTPQSDTKDSSISAFKETLPVVQATREVSTDVKISYPREEAPKFKREYKTGLTNGRSMTIHASSCYYSAGRTYTGELTQSNGNYIFFDPMRIADKILDPELLPILKQYCKEILTMDREYISSSPSTFVDDKGREWKLISQ